nr:MAG TPA: Somatostatin/Cortistatin family [Caudoviricetes sp.]DAO48599.1 MAG TPA: Somatostatin/Cortistatin family [Caudoviricetes sp.]
MIGWDSKPNSIYFDNNSKRRNLRVEFCSQKSACYNFAWKSYCLEFNLTFFTIRVY